MSKALRYLRIVFSATCLVMCGLLIALWVRSYRTNDAISGITDSNRLDLQSWRGRLLVHVSSLTSSMPRQNKWAWNRIPTDQWEHTLKSAEGWGPLVPPPNFVSVRSSPHYWEIWTPHWLLALMLAAVASAPWFRHFSLRFSLRTLLIATTLVALGLWLLLWLSR